MFIDKLTDCEQQILMDLLVHIASCDNKFPKSESKYVHGIESKYELTMKFRPENTVKELCEKIEKDQSKIIILQEIIRTARIDGEYDDKEREIIQQVVKCFGICNSKHSDIDDWVRKGMEWRNQGEVIISTLKPL